LKCLHLLLLAVFVVCSGVNSLFTPPHLHSDQADKTAKLGAELLLSLVLPSLSVKVQSRSSQLRNRLSSLRAVCSVCSFSTRLIIVVSTGGMEG
jgi:hypothetical protein